MKFKLFIKIQYHYGCNVNHFYNNIFLMKPAPLCCSFICKFILFLCFNYAINSWDAVMSNYRMTDT